MFTDMEYECARQSTHGWSSITCNTDLFPFNQIEEDIKFTEATKGLLANPGTLDLYSQYVIIQSICDRDMTTAGFPVG